MRVPRQNVPGESKKIRACSRLVSGIFCRETTKGCSSIEEIFDYIGMSRLTEVNVSSPLKIKCSKQIIDIIFQ